MKLVILAMLSLFAIVAPIGTVFASRNDQTCDGLPKLNVETPMGFCIGIFADGFKFPRSVLALNDDTLLVADMGGWTANRGTIWRIKYGEQKFALLKNLDRPAHLAVPPAAFREKFLKNDPPSTFYFGTTSAIYKFHEKMTAPEAVIDQLPSSGRHPLKVFTFDENGGLYVNIGSDSDNCGDQRNQPKCKEAEEDQRGTIFFFAWDPSKSAYKKPEVFARGLRNSMAMAWFDQKLLVAENSRDAIEKADPSLNGELLPPDEINHIVRDQHYGWPYCYGDKVASPEFPSYNCKTTTPPLTFLPAHSAPLGMVLYDRTMFPQAFQNKLLVSLHGYRATGHRIIVVDPVSGAMIGDLVRDWTKERTGHQGAPVGLTLARDGSVYIADDKNRRVLKLFYAKQPDNKPQNMAAINPLRFQTKTESNRPLATTRAKPNCKATTDSSIGQEVQTKIFDELCYTCHGRDSGKDSLGHAGRLAFHPCDAQANLKMLLNEGPEDQKWLTPGASEGPLLDRLIGKVNGLPPMPPGGLSPELKELVKSWAIQTGL